LAEDTATTRAAAPDSQDDAGVPRLEVDDLHVRYGKREVLHGVSLTVGKGEIVTVLGHNGAGKTTLLKAIFGLLPVTGGSVRLDGDDATGISTVESVVRGVSYTPAEAPIFRELTVRENLSLGAFTLTDVAARRERMERVFEMFPILRERQDSLAGRFSGGQQRMLSIGLAFMSGAKLWLLDEPSLGIAPSLVIDIFEKLEQLSRDDRLSILLIEQNVRAALPLAARAYFVRSGKMILEESADKAMERDDWWELF
jgi:branched-chain amino acid transport system ATP-binding protein